ncbi:MAG: hypothetical protein AB7N76_22645 [Planctomycetota bacterium]
MDKERQAALLGEVKFAERQLEKVQAKLPPLEQRIKDALRAGKREAAQELAVVYEQLKDEAKQAEAKVARAKQALEQGKRQSAELKQALKGKELSDAMGAIADTVLSVGKDDDILERLERENALSEARMDVALGASEGGVDPQTEAELRRLSAEDILKEFEGS